MKDFGPIAEATVELRPLTVLVGASNTGKSYLAILLYALHRFFGAQRPVPRWLSQHMSNAGQDDRPPEREPLESVTAWLQALEASRGQGRFDDVLPEAITALVRPVLEDVGNFATRRRRSLGTGA